MTKPLKLPYKSYSPTIGLGLTAGTDVALIGRLVLGQGATLGPKAVLRADGHHIDVGEEFTLGLGGTLHIAHDVLPTKIGHRVAAGGGAVIHACTVGNDCAIGEGAVILDGAEINDQILLDAHSIVYPGTILKGGYRYAGRPAREIGPISLADITAYRAKIHAKTLADIEAHPSSQPPRNGTRNFIAQTARLNGQPTMGEDASIFFSCHIEASRHPLTIGARSNVQDNSVLLTDSGPLNIGPDTTIGHNVRLNSCYIGKNCLIGMGANLESGTFVEDGTMVAAGTTTAPGQRLTAGHLWAGTPARPISTLKERHLAMIAGTIPHYIAYAQYFNDTQGAEDAVSSR